MLNLLLKFSDLNSDFLNYRISKMVSTMGMRGLNFSKELFIHLNYSFYYYVIINLKVIILKKIVLKSLIETRFNHAIY